jgi:hypothetical protein
MKIASCELPKYLKIKIVSNLLVQHVTRIELRNTHKTLATVSEEPVPHVRQTKWHNTIKVEVKEMYIWMWN